MPLQNRVLPSGEIASSPMRGTLMGNRGGRIHDPLTMRLVPNRRWTSKQWICCQTEFNNRHREVMGNSYTELFFLDEVSAFSAGHRPCFECRRADFLSFAECWRKAIGASKRPTAKQMDDVLHAERLDGKNKRIQRRFWEELPVGTMITHDGGAVAKTRQGALRWTDQGYESLSAEISFENRLVSCLTPDSILAVLAKGYHPQWHPTAKISDQ